MRRFDRYRVADDDEVQASYFNGVHEDVDLRLHAVEEKAVGWDEQVERFEDVALGKIDDALLPILQEAIVIRERIETASYDVLFLTGIGEVFPYIRSHSVLNNLQSVVTGKPMLMFFPGRYEQSDTLGSSLVLFGRLKDDQYYRAKNILEQEA